MRAFVGAGSWALALGMWSCGGGGGGGGGAFVPVAPVAPVATVAPPPGTPATPPPPDAPAAPPEPAPAPAPVPEPPATPAESPPAASRVVSDTITSAKTGATYALEIYLPASYDGSSAAYPVIYAMDADGVFNPPNTRFSDLRNILEQHGTEAILVGIGGSARREQDYTMPGAVPYHDFLALELVPFIESKYRADAGQRLLTGLSLSGSMAGIALFLEGAAGSLVFSHFLAFEAAFDFQTAEYEDLEQRMHDALGDRPLPATLVLTRCDKPVECNFEPVGRMHARLLARGYPGLSITETTYSTTHTETDIPSFADAIARLLP
ncbi:alpha/beta hydrolase [Variovorax sp. VRV01]|uniref:alpha/beta hydrolase n=1 Tax=Variovorax sp. VRV01 TaxID=2769259 RepID=UPI001CE17B0D|nr:alpha/beta hydrolase-fold protein [Variovorax sp. VRV01]